MQLNVMFLCASKYVLVLFQALKVTNHMETYMDKYPNYTIVFL